MKNLFPYRSLSRTVSRIGRTVLHAIALTAVGCTSFNDAHPYDADLLTLEIASIYPVGYESAVQSGIEVKATEITNGNAYTARMDAAGRVSFRIPRGIYRIAVSDRREDAIFNGALEEVRLTGEGPQRLELPLFRSVPGTLVIKEIYCGGCPMTPATGNLQNDQYVILHNNDNRTQYLDGLCFGIVAPSASGANNNWVTTVDGELRFQEFAPVFECVWQFQGTGSDFPLAPGEDAVIAIRGAIDFTQDFSLSVDLNKPEYFATFSRLHFENEKLNLSPGDQIQPSHLLQVIKKTGVSKAYSLAINSPAIIIFRPEEGFDFTAYLDNDDACVATEPGGSAKCVKVPWAWILDGVEIFYSTNNRKRLMTEIDAGAFPFSVTFQCHTIHRKLDETATAANGYPIYVDTNNSSVDFYERPTQSLND